MPMEDAANTNQMSRKYQESQYKGQTPLKLPKQNCPSIDHLENGKKMEQGCKKMPSSSPSEEVSIEGHAPASLVFHKNRKDLVDPHTSLPGSSTSFAIAYEKQHFPFEGAISLSSVAPTTKQRRDNNDKVAALAARAAIGHSTIVPTQTHCSVDEGMQSPTIESSDASREENYAVEDLSGKEIPWNVEHHKAFVAAIFEVGLKTCSPSVIMENMRKKPRYVTRERTKSHLQKFRIVKDRNKDDFMMEYEAFMEKTESIKRRELEATGKEPISKVILSKVLKGGNATKLVGGRAAALLSFSILNGCSTEHGPDQIPFKGKNVSFPNMTEEEKNSSLGSSLLQIKELLRNMTDVLLKERHGLPIAPNLNGDEYDSPSSSDGEYYSDFEEENNKMVSTSETSGNTNVPTDPGAIFQHHWPYMHHGHFRGGPPGHYPPPIVRPGPPVNHPPFALFAFGGTVRPMPPQHVSYPHPPHHYNQSSYGPPPTHAQTNQNHPGPPHAPSYNPVSEPFQASYDYNCYHPYHLPHNHHHNNETSGHEHNSSNEPIGDNPGNYRYDCAKDYSVAAKKKGKRSNPDKVSSKNGRNAATNFSFDHFDHARHRKKRSREDGERREKQSSLYALPPASDTTSKRERRQKSSCPISAAFEIFAESDEDRGIPGASKVASPFHQRPSPVQPKGKNADRPSPHHHPTQSGSSTPICRKHESLLFMESPFENEPSRRPKDSTPKKTPLSSKQHQTDKHLSPDSIFAEEPHLSPGETSFASKISTDAHHLVWEPLSIDMQDEFVDHDPGSHQTKKGNSALDSTSSDVDLSRRRCNFFPDNV